MSVKKSIYFSFFSFLPPTCHNQPGSLHRRRIRPPSGRRQTGGCHMQLGPPGTSQFGSFWSFWAERTTERSEVVRALETKFLRFWAGQEQDSVLSVGAATGRAGVLATLAVVPSPSALCASGLGRGGSGPEPPATRAGLWRPARGRAGKDPATEATVLRRLLLCFSFFGEAVRRHPCSCCRGHGPSTVLAERRQREQPRQAACGRFALALARRPAPAERRGRRGGRRRPARALPINAYGLSLAIVGA